VLPIPYPMFYVLESPESFSSNVKAAKFSSLIDSSPISMDMIRYDKNTILSSREHGDLGELYPVLFPTDLLWMVAPSTSSPSPPYMIVAAAFFFFFKSIIAVTVPVYHTTRKYMTAPCPLFYFQNPPSQKEGR